jgi:hypothetical protein
MKNSKTFTQGSSTLLSQPIGEMTARETERLDMHVKETEMTRYKVKESRRIARNNVREINSFVLLIKNIEMPKELKSKKKKNSSNGRKSLNLQDREAVSRQL